MDSIATRSTKVEGYLKCGKSPQQNAHVRLFRSSSEGKSMFKRLLINFEFSELNDVIASGVSDAQGRFSIEGDTSRFGGAGGFI